MATTKKIIIGTTTGTTIVAILAYLMTIQGVTITGSGDISCAGTLADPCISYFNVTSANYTLKFFNITKWQKLDFSPQIKDYQIYKLTSTGKWSKTDFPINMTKGVLYQFKIVGYKYREWDNVKWGVGIGDAYLDPWWNTTYNYRYPIIENTTAEMPVAINDTGKIQSDILWALLKNESYVYSTATGPSGSIAIGNETDQKYWENESDVTNKGNRSVWTGATGVWHFGEGTGSYANDSTGIYNITLSGTAWNTTGKFGKGVIFNGVSDYGNATANPTFTSNFTWSIWYAGTDTTGPCLMGKWTDGSDSYILFYMGYFTSGRMSFIVREGGAGTVGANAASINIADGGWHQIVGTRDITNQRVSIFVDGNMLNQSTGADAGLNTDQNGGLIFGANGALCNALQGTIDESRVYTTILDNSTILNMYYNGINNLTRLGSVKSQSTSTSFAFTINGSASDKIMEFNESAALSASNATNISIGKNILPFTNTSGTLSYDFYSKPYFTKFNNSLLEQNATRLGTNYIISIGNMSRNNSFISCKANFTGFIDAGTYAQNILIDTGNDGVIDNYLMGQLQEDQKLYVNTLSDGSSGLNITFVAAGSTVKYFNISSMNTTNVTFNMTGYAENIFIYDDSEDDWNYTCSNYGWCHNAANAVDENWNTSASLQGYGGTNTMQFIEFYNSPVTDSSTLSSVRIDSKYYLATGNEVGQYGSIQISVYNYSTNSWNVLFTDTLTTADTTEDTLLNTTNFTLKAPNNNHINSSFPLLIRTILTNTWTGYGYPAAAHYYEGAMNWNSSSTTITNVSVDAGSDGVIDWKYVGNFNDTTPQRINNVSEAFNKYIQTKCNTTKSCKVPITISTGSAGKMNISHVRINTTITGVDLNVSRINSLLSTATTPQTNITINITNNTKGIVNMRDLYCPYYGNGNVTVTGCNSTTCISRNITVYYSNFSRVLPYTFTNSTLWYPPSNNSVNVTPYGQTSSIPIYNITTKSLEKNMTLAWRFNEPLSGNCMNITWSSNSTYNASQTINITTSTISTYQIVRSNMNATDQNIGIWLWLHLYNCSRATPYFTPNISLKTCCSGCTSCW